MPLIHDRREPGCPRCVVTLGAGNWYARGVARLREGMVHSGGVADLLGWADCYPAGAPEHDESPYAFKTWALNAAADRGYRYLLWLDAACYPVKSLGPVFDIVAADGYFFCENGFACGQWCSDRALRPLGVTREEVMALSEITSYAVGLDVYRPEIKVLLDEWHRHSLAGTFRGAHTNSSAPSRPEMIHRSIGHVSDDPRVLGHRHDQTALSVLAHKAGLAKRWGRPYPVDYLQAGRDPDPRTVILNHGRIVG